MRYSIVRASAQNEDKEWEVSLQALRNIQANDWCYWKKMTCSECEETIKNNNKQYYPGLFQQYYPGVFRDLVEIVAPPERRKDSKNKTKNLGRQIINAVNVVFPNEVNKLEIQNTSDENYCQSAKK